MKNQLISIIVPCYNEEGNIELLHSQVSGLLAGYSLEFIFVDDCSSDGTLKVLEHLSAAATNIKYLSFSRNFGHQNAIRAGLEYCTGDCAITMDADLQHPPELLTKLVDKWHEGNDIVYTVRDDKENVSFFKKLTASGFYKLMNGISDIKIVPGAADFRLLDKRIVRILVNDINEYHLFYRGMINWLGFRQAFITYTPNKRFSGKSSYSMKKMVSLGMDGITSFSIKPLKIATLLGLLFSLFSGIYMIYVLFVTLFTDQAVAGWTSVIMSVLFIGGVNMVLLGIIGEYLGKLYIQSKKRPFFLIKSSNIPQRNE